MMINRKSCRSRKAPFVTSLALACAFVAGNASAGIPVIDGSSIARSVAEYIAKAAKWGQDLAHFKSQIDHMTQQLISLDQMISNMGLTMTDMNERPNNEGVAERCQGGDGSILSNFFAAVGLNLNGDITAQQKQKCAQIVTLENMKYNEQVRMLKKLQNSQEKITQLKSNFSSADTNGKMDTNMGAAEGLVAQMTADAQYAQTIIRVYDGMIVSLKEDQKQLAKRALGGQTSAIGSLVSTAALAGALQLND